MTVMSFSNSSLMVTSSRPIRCDATGLVIHKNRITTTIFAVATVKTAATDRPESIRKMLTVSISEAA